MHVDKRTANSLLLFFSLLALLNISFAGYSYYGTRSYIKSEKYSYVGDDFPSTLPVKSLGEISMTIEESLRFRLQDDPSIAQSWVSSLPQGIGFVRLGPEKRAFAISMFHELHCLLEIHQVIVQRAGPNKHVQHCLNYIRQGVLCSADLTLEPINYLTHNFTSHSVIGDRACKDWRAAHKFAEDNSREWDDFRRTQMLKQS